MIRSTVQFFYTAGPRISIKSPLTREKIGEKIILSRASGALLLLESLPENPRDNAPSIFVYLEMDGLAFVSISEEKDKSLIEP